MYTLNLGIVNGQYQSKGQYRKKRTVNDIAKRYLDLNHGNVSWIIHRSIHRSDLAWKWKRSTLIVSHIEWNLRSLAPYKHSLERDSPFPRHSLIESLVKSRCNKFRINHDISSRSSMFLCLMVRVLFFFFSFFLSAYSITRHGGTEPYRFNPLTRNPLRPDTRW